MLRRAPLGREQLALIATLALLTAIAWALALAQMSGMAGMGGSMGAPAARDGWPCTSGCGSA